VADHLSDEEQLDAIKKWWRENGTSLLLLVVLVAGGWFGWNYLQSQKKQSVEDSSHVYMAMVDAVVAWEKEPTREHADQVAAHGETLKKLNEDGLYARFAALTLSRLYMTDGDTDNAIEELKWARAKTEDQALAALIDLRLANAEFARDNGDGALQILAQSHPEEFSGLFRELRGDIYYSLGQNEQALEAYQGALDQLEDSDPAAERARAMLELKINDAMPAGTESASGEEDA